MDFVTWLQNLSRDADPTQTGFQAQSLYVLMCVVLPVAVGLFVGFGLRFIENAFGVQFGKGGAH